VYGVIVNVFTPNPTTKKVANKTMLSEVIYTNCCKQNHTFVSSENFYKILKTILSSSSLVSKGNCCIYIDVNASVS